MTTKTFPLFQIKMQLNKNSRVSFQMEFAQQDRFTACLENKLSRQFALKTV